MLEVNYNHLMGARLTKSLCAKGARGLRKSELELVGLVCRELSELWVMGEDIGAIACLVDRLGLNRCESNE